MTQANTVGFNTVGFIGLGEMGHRMVRHLAGEGTLLVSDSNVSRATEVAQATGAQVATISDMTAVDVVILMLPSSQVVDEVLHGSDGRQGLLEVLKTGAMIIDMSSSAPTNSVHNSEVAQSLGLSFIDAPVSGGTFGADAATLAIMVGGDSADCERARPLLEKIGNRVFHVGKVGAGHAIKALNNLMGAASLALTSEVFAVGAKFGLDPATMLKVINASSGQNWITSSHWQAQVVERKFACGFKMQLLEKDVRVAMSLYDALGVEAIVSRTVAAACAKALEQAPAGADMSVMAQQAEKALES